MGVGFPVVVLRLACPPGGRNARLMLWHRSQFRSSAWWTSASESTPASPSAPMPCSSWSKRSCSPRSSARLWSSARARSSDGASPASTMPCTTAGSTQIRCARLSSRLSQKMLSASPATPSTRWIRRSLLDPTPTPCRIAPRSTRPSVARPSQATSSPGLVESSPSVSRGSPPARSSDSSPTPPRVLRKSWWSTATTLVPHSCAPSSAWPLAWRCWPAWPAIGSSTARRHRPLASPAALASTAPSWRCGVLASPSGRRRCVSWARRSA